MSNSDDLDDDTQAACTDGGYHTISVPHWARQEVRLLQRLLNSVGVEALPLALRVEAQALINKNRRPFTTGVTVGIACRAMRAQTAVWAQEQASARK